MTYSYTQISQYLRCPRAYRHRYLDGWREMDTRASLLFGRCFEKALTAYFLRQDSAAVLFKEWGLYRETQLEFSNGDNWERLFRQGVQLLERLAQDARIQIRQNTLQAIALSHGLRRGTTLWSQAGQHAIASLLLEPNAAHRRTQLQTLYRRLERQIGKLDERVRDQALRRPGAKLLLTHPGVGAVTALATDVFLGDPTRFADGKALASYVGMIPSEHSSAGRQRLGKLSKQGSPLLRFLWGEAAMHAVRQDLDLKHFYRHKLQQKGLGKARVAAARKLGIRLYIMLRDQIDYEEFCRRGHLRQKSGSAHAGMPDRNHGPAVQ